jgi:hypothetical protein
MYHFFLLGDNLFSPPETPFHFSFRPPFSTSLAHNMNNIRAKYSSAATGLLLDVFCYSAIRVVYTPAIGQEKLIIG